LNTLDTRYLKMLKKSISFHPSPSPQRGEGGGEGEKGDPILATHQSAIKRAKQNEIRRTRNLHIETTIKTSVKKVREAIDEKDIEGAKKALLKTIPLIQKGHSKGILHKNTSARKISRLTQAVNALSAK